MWNEATANGRGSHSTHQSREKSLSSESAGTMKEQVKTRGIPPKSAHRIIVLVNPLPTSPVVEHRKQLNIYPKEKNNYFFILLLLDSTPKIKK